MTDKEQLEQEACDNGITVDYVDFKSDRLCGLYVDGSIAIKEGMISSKTADTIAEELGHHYTSVGNILHQDTINARKQERTARLWSYNKRIGLTGILSSFQNHCANRYEIAEYLGVSEDTLTDALECYRQIYGRGVMVGNYFIQFEPSLQVYEYFQLKQPLAF